jgi:hypothetical protein
VSPLRSIIAQLKAEDVVDLSDREKIPLFVAPPWWHGADIHIAPGDDKARAFDQGVKRIYAVAGKTRQIFIYVVVEVQQESGFASWSEEILAPHQVCLNLLDE